MQSSGPTKCHGVEGAPTFWTCHLAIKQHTFAVESGVQESKVQWLRQRPKEMFADMPTSVPVELLLNTSGDFS